MDPLNEECFRSQVDFAPQVPVVDRANLSSNGRTSVAEALRVFLWLLRLSTGGVDLCDFYSAGAYPILAPIFPLTLGGAT